VDGSELARLAREDGHFVEECLNGALIDQIADDLAADRIVGWMEGALEFGPRALGHRSILAAPHTTEMRDRLNREVKYRELFRPFAPVIPIEEAARYFDIPLGGTRLARFMSGVFPVRREWRSRLEAITHVDGTARVQVLERVMTPRRMHYWRHTGNAPGYRCCSIPRSIWRENLLSIVQWRLLNIPALRDRCSGRWRHSVMKPVRQ